MLNTTEELGDRLDHCIRSGIVDDGEIEKIKAGFADVQNKIGVASSAKGEMEKKSIAQKLIPIFLANAVFKIPHVLIRRGVLGATPT